LTKFDVIDKRLQGIYSEYPDLENTDKTLSELRNVRAQLSIATKKEQKSKLKSKRDKLHTQLGKPNSGMEMQFLRVISEKNALIKRQNEIEELI